MFDKMVNKNSRPHDCVVTCKKQDGFGAGVALPHGGGGTLTTYPPADSYLTNIKMTSSVRALAF